MVVGTLLAVAGGWLDAYTYVCRGHVFANAQTGNVVLLGISLSQGEFQHALSALIPILAFVAGVGVAELVKEKYGAKDQTLFHWRHWMIGLEIAVLAVVSCVPVGDYDRMVNVAISLACAVQFQTFRKVRGNPFSTTVCTGNMRSGTEALCRYLKWRKWADVHRAVCSYGVTVAFVGGACLGAFVSIHWDAVSIPLVMIIYALVYVLMLEDEHRYS